MVGWWAKVCGCGCGAEGGAASCGLGPLHGRDNCVDDLMVGSTALALLVALARL